MRTEYFFATRKCKTVLKLTCFTIFVAHGTAVTLFLCLGSLSGFTYAMWEARTSQDWQAKITDLKDLPASPKINQQHQVTSTAICPKVEKKAPKLRKKIQPGGDPLAAGKDTGDSTGIFPAKHV